MAVHIRLQRKGATHRPFYHLVAADQRSPRDGKYLEKLGYYDPNTQPSTVVMKAERIQHWYDKGAQLSNTASKLLKSQSIKLESRSKKVVTTKAKADAETKEAPKAKTTAKKATAKKTSTKKATTKKASTKKTTAKKTSAKKATAKKKS